MRIASLHGGAGPHPQYAVSAATGDTWFPLHSLGFTARDLRDVIDQEAEIRTRLDDGGGESVAAAELGCPVVRPSKIIAIGLNYGRHVSESRRERPAEPVVFAKFPNSLAGPSSPIVVDSQLTSEADYEVELAVIMRAGHGRVTESNALDAVFGYCVANDISGRDCQRRDPRFTRPKSFDTFCPMGPWITTADEITDPQDLAISSWVNGDLRQHASTGEMLFSIAELIAYLSHGMSMEDGDVLLTGTPGGVGMAMDPPQFLRPGDTVVCEIAGLGRLSNVVTSPSPT